MLKKDGWIFKVTIAEDALTLNAPVLAAGKDMSPDFSAESGHKVRNSRVLGIYQDNSHTAQKPQRHLVIGPGIGTCLMLK